MDSLGQKFGVRVLVTQYIGVRTLLACACAAQASQQDGGNGGGGGGGKEGGEEEGEERGSKCGSVGSRIRRVCVRAEKGVILVLSRNVSVTTVCT